MINIILLLRKPCYVFHLFNLSAWLNLNYFVLEFIQMFFFFLKYFLSSSFYSFISSTSYKNFCFMFFFFGTKLSTMYACMCIRVWILWNFFQTSCKHSNEISDKMWRIFHKYNKIILIKRALPLFFLYFYFVICQQFLGVKSVNAQYLLKEKFQIKFHSFPQ